MVKALLNKPLFCETLEQASGAAKAVKASSSKWLKILYDKIKHYYGKFIAVTIFMIGETWWKSTQACFASKLCIRHACRQFCADYSPGNEFPKELRVWDENQYWKKLEEYEYMVNPFCEASFLMQRYGNTMAHILLVFFNLWKHLSCFGSEDEVDEILSDLESRIKREEFHLFFLAFLVHPVFHQVAIKILDESDKIMATTLTT